MILSQLDEAHGDEVSRIKNGLHEAACSADTDLLYRSCRQFLSGIAYPQRKGVADQEDYYQRLLEVIFRIFFKGCEAEKHVAKGRPDFVLDTGSKKIVIELKKLDGSKLARKPVYEQMKLVQKK